MGKTTIAWTNRTWNCVWGCTRVSQGCRSCYAFAFHDRFHEAYEKHRGVDRHGKPMAKMFAVPFTTVQLLEHRLEDPLRWRKPAMVFVNSMSDLFHKDVPDAYLDRVFDVMRRASSHTFQVLTKRPERMLAYTRDLEDGVPGNVWLGTSVEDQRVLGRVDILRHVPGPVRFLSCEPLIGDVTPIDLENIDWVIAGGESGDDARPLSFDWLFRLRDACRARGIPYFVKQLGSVWAQRHGAGEKKGEDPEEWPEALRIRQWPLDPQAEQQGLERFGVDA